MDNKAITAVLNRVYNDWFCRWKRKVIPDDSLAWSMLVKEAGSIMEEFDYHPLAVHLIQDLLDELEERSRNGENK